MTAVEWLLNEFQEVHKDYGGLDTNWLKRFDKAKEMELEKLQQSYEKGFNDARPSSNEFGSISIGKFWR